MKVRLLIITLLLSITCFANITGFWKTIDDKTGKAQSIVGIYEYQGYYYGRIIATYDLQGHFIEETLYAPKKRAPGVKGHPYYAGMDIIWDVKPKGQRFTDGSILDPEHGKVYGVELWRHNHDLVVRGKLLCFGRNQVWLQATDADFPPGFEKPDLTQFVPVIPK